MGCPEGRAATIHGVQSTASAILPAPPWRAMAIGLMRFERSTRGAAFWTLRGRATLSRAQPLLSCPRPLRRRGGLSRELSRKVTQALVRHIELSLEQMHARQVRALALSVSMLGRSLGSECILWH